ncbi:MAG: hypothetical protein NUV47_03465 [Patescibacteria group bacterium]|nr:hypothetical protein [Patescibacteria group bacterium]
MTTSLIENSFAITTHLLKKDLKKARQKTPINGYLNIFHNNKPSIADYLIEYDGENTYLVINFAEKSQKILLSEHQLTFGTRTYLNCACGHRTNSLYLNKGIFACKKCHNLHYQSTSINRNTLHGKFLYQQNQILKIINMRESMNRIFYKSRYSKPFVRWLDLCGKAGLIKEVEDAQALITAINNYRQQV